MSFSLEKSKTRVGIAEGTVTTSDFHEGLFVLIFVSLKRFGRRLLVWYVIMTNLLHVLQFISSLTAIFKTDYSNKSIIKHPQWVTIFIYEMDLNLALTRMIRVLQFKLWTRTSWGEASPNGVIRTVDDLRGSFQVRWLSGPAAIWDPASKSVITLGRPGGGKARWLRMSAARGVQSWSTAASVSVRVPRESFVP